MHVEGSKGTTVFRIPHDSTHRNVDSWLVNYRILMNKNEPSVSQCHIYTPVSEGKLTVIKQSLNSVIVLLESIENLHHLSF